jgi:hypothetical protein
MGRKEVLEQAVWCGGTMPPVVHTKRDETVNTYVIAIAV